MKLTDYVINFLAEQGINHVFGLTGGAAVHFFDSASKHRGITPIFNHHEQAAAFAAEAYARITNNLGAAFFTTGPGGTNAITGVCAAWLDSVPCIFISGQARKEHVSRGKPVRQIGVQEFDIVGLVERLTKYAAVVESPEMIRYHMEKAAYIAKTGRPGPVWLDIPLNFQWASVDPEKIKGFEAEKDPTVLERHISEDLISDCLEMLSVSKRPLILAGYGVRLSKGMAEFGETIERVKIPFISTYNASDILPTDNPHYVGRLGISGQRGANLAVQNCDLLLCVGSHLSLPLTGTLHEAFARGARIIVVDIDPVELQNVTVHKDLLLQADAKAFLRALQERVGEYTFADIDRWRKQCHEYKTYNTVPAEWKKERDIVNPYIFVDTLSEELEGEDVIVVDGGGTVFYTGLQATRIKGGQRLITSSGIAAMGSGLPESVGACIGAGRRRTVCLCGDGSMQLNIQELQTIAHHGLPIKIVIFNNGGYLSIRHTQDGFLEHNHVGSESAGGMSLPDFQNLARAYGIEAMRIRNHRGLREKIRKMLRQPGPIVCEIMLSKEQQVIPSQGFVRRDDGSFSPRPLEDMYPYLERGEFRKNMIVDPWPGS